MVGTSELQLHLPEAKSNEHLVAEVIKTFGRPLKQAETSVTWTAWGTVKFVPPHNRNDSR